MPADPVVHRELDPVDNATWISLLELRNGVEHQTPRSVEDEAADVLQGLQKLTSSSHGSVLFTVRPGGPRDCDPLRGWRVAYFHAPRFASMMPLLNRVAGKLTWTEKHSPVFRETGFHRAWYQPEAGSQARLTGAHKLMRKLMRRKASFASICTLRPDLEATVLLHRETDDPFGRHHANIGLAAMHALQPVMTRWARCLGIVDAATPLTVRQRAVLVGLLRGLSEKEVADELGLQTNYVHKLVTGLYRCFDVRSRPQLLSLCLTSAAPTAPPNPSKFKMGTFEPDRTGVGERDGSTTHCATDT